MDVLVAFRTLLRARDARNYLPTDWRQFNYIAVLRDKHLFDLFALDRGHPIPRTIARLDAVSIEWVKDACVTSLEEMAGCGPFDAFAKPVVGIWGRGAFQLRADSEGMTINGEPATLDDLRTRLDGRYVLQERIIQHGQLAALHPASVNTLRLVTVIDGGRPRLIGALLRVGVSGNPVDNWGSGGLVVGVDTNARCLRGRGIFKPGMGGSTTHHPDSGIAFEGYRIPHIEEAVDIAARFHADLPSIHSIGWDIAMTKDGPLVIEANDHWNVGIHVLVDPGFIERFVVASATEFRGGLRSTGQRRRARS